MKTIEEMFDDFLVRTKAPEDNDLRIFSKRIYMTGARDVLAELIPILKEVPEGARVPILHAIVSWTAELMGGAGPAAREDRKPCAQ